MARLRSTLVHRLIQYYVALRLSAGAIAPIFVTQLDDDPAPIVRPYTHVNSGLWDHREVIMAGRSMGILTTPAGSRIASRTPMIHDN